MGSIFSSSDHPYFQLQTEGRFCHFCSQEFYLLLFAIKTRLFSDDGMLMRSEEACSLIHPNYWQILHKSWVLYFFRRAFWSHNYLQIKQHNESAPFPLNLFILWKRKSFSWICDRKYIILVYLHKHNGAWTLISYQKPKDQPHYTLRCLIICRHMVCSSLVTRKFDLNHFWYLWTRSWLALSEF